MTPELEKVLQEAITEWEHSREGDLLTKYERALFAFAFEKGVKAAAGAPE